MAAAAKAEATKKGKRSQGDTATPAPKKKEGESSRNPQVDMKAAKKTKSEYTNVMSRTNQVLANAAAGGARDWASIL